MGGPVARRPRLEDVAAEVGLSIASVSLVLRGAPGPSAATRARVLAAAERLGYRADRAASLLARRRTRLLGVPVALRDAFRAELAEELQLAADARGYTVTLSAITPVHDEARVAETLLDLRCEALVLLAPTLPAEALGDLGTRVPLVVASRHVAPAGFDVVRVADDLGVARAVDHLLALGHRDLVHVDGGDHPSAAERRAGFMRAAGERGRVVPGGLDEEAGATAARAMLDAGELPTAVVAANDRCAVGVLDVFVRAGIRVPEDVSLVGYDDTAFAGLAHVGLTTVSQEAAAQAREAVAAVVERLDGDRSQPREIVLTPHLVERTSTAPPRPTRELRIR
ncbi:MAG: LacI family DNA-binding transcriptional regulator [Pseudonocardia sp.]